MTTRKEIIGYCMTLPLAYEDYPFTDINWTVMRRRDTKRGFAWIFEKDGKMWLNVKIEPYPGLYFREAYRSVIPAYHMNKEHWNSVILDGSVPDDLIREMIDSSYDLCGKKRSK